MHYIRTAQQILVPHFPSKGRPRESKDMRVNVSRRGVQEPEIHSANDTRFFFGLSPLIETGVIWPLYGNTQHQKKRAKATVDALQRQE